MVCKYKLVNLDYTDWVEYITFNRDTEKENALFSDVLGLTEGDEYIFINKNFGSPPGTRVCEHIDINPSSMRVVNMEFYTGFSVFDWCKVIENATQIHTVDTIIVCIIEKLITCNNLNIYSRWTPPSFTSVKPILSARWKYNK
jgi:hypothetical protein